MKRLRWGLVVALMIGVITTGQAWSMPLVFDLGTGGTISFGGAGTPLVTTDGVVTRARVGTTMVPIVGGDLDFATGVFGGGGGAPGSFFEVFGPGGGLTIMGDIPVDAVAGPVLLLAGTFDLISSLICCTNGAASFSGLLNPTFLNPDLASALGFGIPVGGSVAQTEIVFNSTLVGPGTPFVGQQTGGAVQVVPEPVSLLLLGSGLLGLGILGRKKIRG